jgi:hypothetical protein
VRYVTIFDPYKDDNHKLLLNDTLVNKWMPSSPSEQHSKIEYILNSDNYRSIEFDGNAEIMTLGCSYTYGLGLPSDMIWPNILSNKLDKSVVNLAQPGDSTPGQIRKAFSYFKKYGNPKIIVAAFPLYRMEFPIVPKKFLKENDDTLNKIGNYIFYDDWFEDYAKSPYDPEKVIPKEVSLFYTQSHIQMLEQYCKTNGIKLIWSVWEHYKSIFDFLSKEQPDLLKNYCNIDWDLFFDYNTGYYNKREIECKDHDEYSSNELFYYAADRENGEFCHLGWHFHMHLAEGFYAKI